MNKYLDKIDNDIAEKHLLKHPFYLAWTRGELSKEALADYARQYYHHVAAFPTYLSAVHANCNDQTTRKQLLNNLIDEEPVRQIILSFGSSSPKASAFLMSMSGTQISNRRRKD